MDIKDDNLSTDPGPSLGEIVRAARTNWLGLSLRALAREAGISAGQLSRIESGQTPSPSIKTLQLLAPATNLHLSILLALAGHLDDRAARAEFSALVKAARKELVREYDDDGAYADELAARARALTDDSEIKDFACLLATLPARSTETPTELEYRAPGRNPDPGLLSELLVNWSAMSPDRRWRLLQTARDFAAASLPHPAARSARSAG